jgi:hypothetical protein
MGGWAERRVGEVDRMDVMDRTDRVNPRRSVHLADPPFRRFVLSALAILLTFLTLTSVMRLLALSLSGLSTLLGSGAPKIFSFPHS